MSPAGRLAELVVVVVATSFVMCGGGQSVVEFDPATLPLDAYLVCDFDDLDLTGVVIRCTGTFGDPVCETSTGVGVACSAGVSTSVPIVGTVGGTLYSEASVDDDGWSAEVKVCATAGPFQRCAVAPASTR